MLSTMFDRGSLPVLEAILQYTNARHKAIAKNIANVGTEGYRAMDVDAFGFGKALARAFEERRESPTGVFELPATCSVRSVAEGLRFRTVESGEAGALKRGGNNVDLDMEKGKLARNGGLHDLAAALLSQQFAMLREAIAGRVIA